ncbi:hypothetical protein F5Y14DRAFT_434449 [Nemania sp. NC0429]|nr:hypothetical protein F5Y14DRAFT_434449 [Nemania sp. NC0429]
MVYRIISKRSRAISNGFYAGQIRSKSTVSQRFTIAASHKATQRQVLDEISKHTSRATQRTYHETPGENGIAILASKDFTNWLEDEDFMSAFLGTLFKPSSAAEPKRPILHVLSGITDSIGPHRLSSEPRSGFSVLCGPTNNLLPELWAKESFTGTSQDSTSNVSFTTKPLIGNTGGLNITLPLANTVFQNGRRSTLYASRWDINSEGSIRLRMRHPKTTQVIVDNGSTVDHTSSIVPLLPLTLPRKIVAGLGNIVRQVEVDGTPTPASKELEIIIPELFEDRARREPSYIPAPIGVWCWVIPPHLTGTKIFDNLQLFKAGCSQLESEIVQGSMKLFSELLSSGCRLHKILSGGGGWGAKQGLLSLDPETSLSLPGQDDDMEMFIRSFEERNSAEPTSGLATPGSSLLFCVEPRTTNAETLSNQVSAPAKTALSFGVTRSSEYTRGPSPRPEPIEIIDDHFGISSATGLFLQTIPEFPVMIDGGSMGRGATRGSFATKLDVPGAYFFS